MKVQFALSLAMLCGLASFAAAQDRETKVRNDRKAVQQDESWIYDDLEKGLAEAARSKKPAMIVIRCIP